MTTTRKVHLDSLAITLLLVCCLFWGFQQLLIKATIREVPPMFQASLRLGVIVFIVQTDTDKGDIPLKINALQRRGGTT